MAFAKQFVVDLVKTHDNYYGWPNAVGFVRAHWNITHSDYPSGEAKHYFVAELDVDAITADSFVAIDDVTDAILEQWVTGGMTSEDVLGIENNAISLIRSSHFIESLTTHYTNPNL